MNGNPATPEEVETIVQLRKEGLNLQQIADRVGRTRRSVEVIVVRHRENISHVRGWDRLICTPRFGAK